MIQYHKGGFSIIKKGKKWIVNVSRDFGKWLIYSKSPDFLARFAGKLDALVEDKKVEQVKFVNVKELSKLKKNPLPKRKESFLCTYCWRKDKRRIKYLLKRIGLEPQEWKSNFQTVLDWLPRGDLYEEIKRNYPKEKFKHKKRDFVSIQYWNFIKEKLRKNLPKDKFHKIRQHFLEALSESS